MTGAGRLPDLGGQLRPLIQALPPGIQPRLMARLERAAADRYRAWAAACLDPAAAEGLRLPRRVKDGAILITRKGG